MNYNSGKPNNWLALILGNSRLHWAWFQQDTLRETWDTRHLKIAVEPDQLPQTFLSASLLQQQLTQIPVCIASVVKKQTKLWQDYIELNLITLDHLGLLNTYPTLGIDRALAVWSGVETYNCPCLVIDGGTALTFTGVDQQRRLVGGAILPGLRSQLTGLRQNTPALPTALSTIKLSPALPKRWALDTEGAIASGIIHTAIAGIHSYIDDWQQQFPNSKLIFTGGDGELLAQYFSLQFPIAGRQIIVDHNLIFTGIKLACQNYLGS